MTKIYSVFRSLHTRNLNIGDFSFVNNVCNTYSAEEDDALARLVFGDPLAGTDGIEEGLRAGITRDIPGEMQIQLDNKDSELEMLRKLNAELQAKLLSAPAPSDSGPGAPTPQIVPVVKPGVSESDAAKTLAGAAAVGTVVRGDTSTTNIKTPTA